MTRSFSELSSEKSKPGVVISDDNWCKNTPMDPDEMNVFTFSTAS